ncbi:hypothetical protein HDU86_006289 [Geranomyces michiganensis]|nr:hypothetical protein HDU86_006289 [Geranomyces michiganensis]
MGAAAPAKAACGGDSINMDWATAQPVRLPDGPSGLVAAAAAVGPVSHPHRSEHHPAFGASVLSSAGQSYVSDAQQPPGRQASANGHLDATGVVSEPLTNPLWGPLPTRANELEEALQFLALNLSQTPQAEAYCNWLLSQLRLAVQSTTSAKLGWQPGAYNVRLIGSHAYALAHPASALDVEIYKVDPRAHEKTLDDVGQMLRASSHACDTFEQSVTVMRCDALNYLELTTRFESLKIHLFLHHPTAWRDAYEIDRCLAERAPHLQTVCIVFAHWCHLRRAFGLETGGFNMYNIVILVNRLCQRNTMHLYRQGPGKAASTLFLLLLDHLAHGFRGTHNTVSFGPTGYRPAGLSPDILNPTAPQLKKQVANWRSLLTELMSSVAVIKSRQTGAMRHTKPHSDPYTSILKGIVEVGDDIAFSRRSFAQRWAASCRDSRTGVIAHYPLDLNALAPPEKRNVPPKPATVRVVNRRDPYADGLFDLTEDVPFTPTHAHMRSPDQAARDVLETGRPLKGTGRPFKSCFKISDRWRPERRQPERRGFTAPYMNLRPTPRRIAERVVHTTNMKSRPTAKPPKRRVPTEVYVIDSSSDSDSAPVASNSSPAAPSAPPIPAGLSRTADLAPIPGELLALFSSPKPSR